MTYDAIVLGLGGMGSAASSALARRGRRVLGLEQFSLGHDLGSSHGHTRIIRQAYYEHPDYVPLVRRAYDLWRELEERAGMSLFHIHPCLSLGPPESELLTGVQASAKLHGLDIEDLDVAEVRKRYPQFQIDDSFAGVLERGAGYLLVDDCVRAMQEDARRHGAELHEWEEVLSWNADDNGVTVKTTVGEYRAERLIVTAGPWAGKLLADIGVPLTVMRQTAFWFGGGAAFGTERFPTFIAETDSGHFYGIPAVAGQGVKIARHYGAPELPDARNIQREVQEADEDPVRDFIRKHIPSAKAPNSRSSVCIYTLTPDRHFVIDRHPLHPNVAFAAGFSGHGFKFAPTVGEILADLAMEGKTKLPIGLFQEDRFH